MKYSVHLSVVLMLSLVSCDAAPEGIATEASDSQSSETTKLEVATQIEHEEELVALSPATILTLQRLLQELKLQEFKEAYAYYESRNPEDAGLIALKKWATANLPQIIAKQQSMSRKAPRKLEDLEISEQMEYALIARRVVELHGLSHYEAGYLSLGILDDLEAFLSEVPDLWEGRFLQLHLALGLNNDESGQAALSMIQEWGALSAVKPDLLEIYERRGWIVSRSEPQTAAVESKPASEGNYADQLSVLLAGEAGAESANAPVPVMRDYAAEIAQMMSQTPEPEPSLEVDQTKLPVGQEQTREERKILSRLSQISAEDRLEILTVLQMVEDVSKMKSTLVRQESARAILNREVREAAYTSSDPYWFRFWLARAAMALEVDYKLRGIEASIQLKRLGIMDSEDSFALKILVRLNRVGWLNMEMPKPPDIGFNQTLSLPLGQTLEMIWVKSGSFMMGSPESEQGRGGDEKQHQVRLTKGYWLGKTEVTQAQWQAVMGDNPSYFKKSGMYAPVESVNWYEAMVFCRKLNERERAAGRLADDYEYSLPSEAQWEYACRAGSTGPYADSIDSIAWYNENSGFVTHSVGQKRSNTWGFCDMHGNVWELCRDWYGDYPSGSFTNPSGASSGTYRVRRGGSWGTSGSTCRSANRARYALGERSSILGFRLALIPKR